MVEFPPSYCPHCGAALPSTGPRYDCPDCDRVVFHTPSIAVQVAVVDSTGGTASVLIGERGTPPAQGRWSTPGGHVDLWEAPREAAARELREETDLVTAPDSLELLEVRDLSPRIPEPGLTDEKQVICLDFVVPVGAARGTPRAADDLADVRWVDQAHIETVRWAYESDPSVCAQAITGVRD